jgi:uncharacterized protein (DUF58 family)
MAGIDVDNNLLMMLASLCAAGLVLNLFSGWRGLRRISVQRIVPEVMVAGQPFVIRYSVTNRRRWGCARCIHIMDELPSPVELSRPEVFVPILRPGETVTLGVPVVSPRRGRIRLSTIRVATRFPFGVFTKMVKVRQDQDLIVFPALGRLLTDVQLTSRSSDASGGTWAARLAGDEEFYGVREYRSGDNPRRIHWRRSARTGQLMIREMARTREHQLWCVVNTRVNPRDARQTDRLELAISCAATVICDALEHGVKIGLICNGEPMVVLPPTGGRTRRARLLRELAARSTNADDLLAPHIRRLAWPARWRGPCMLFSAVEDEDLASAERLLDRAIGPTTRFVPGGVAFEGLFCPADGDRRNNQGSSPGNRGAPSGAIAGVSVN